MPVFLRVGVDVAGWRLRDRRHRVKAQALPLGQVWSVSELSLGELTLKGEVSSVLIMRQFRDGGGNTRNWEGRADVIPSKFV